MNRWLDIILNLLFGCACLFIFWLLAQVFLFSSFRIPSGFHVTSTSEGGLRACVEADCGGAPIQPA